MMWLSALVRCLRARHCDAGPTPTVRRQDSAGDVTIWETVPPWPLSWEAVCGTCHRFCIGADSATVQRWAREHTHGDQ